MNQAAVLSMLHEPADRNSAVREFRTRPVLAWTLHRLSAATSLGTKFILAWDDQSSAVQPIAAECGARVITTGPRTPQPTMDAVTAARRWADGWRGGPLQTCEFDRGFHGPFLSNLAKQFSLESLLLIDPAAALVDPALIDALVHHAAANPTRPLIFSQAAPGLSGTLIRTALVDQLASMNTYPGKFVHYQPSQPTRDPISEPNCAPVPTLVARTTNRFTFDSGRQIARLSSATAHLNGQLIATGAEGIVRTLAEPQPADPLPRETILEITPRRATTPIFAPAGHIKIDRPDLSLNAARRIFEQLADTDDTRLTLGGAGDPLLADNLFDILAAARIAGIRAIHLRTDLLGVSPDRLDQLVDSSVDLISIHIPALTARTYQSVMGIDGLNTVIENIKLLLARRAARARATPILIPVFTKCRENLGEMETWYDKWLPVLGTAVIQGASDYAGQIPDHAAADMTPPARRPCTRINSKLHILSNGRVTSCEQDVRGSQSAGDIETNSLTSIWSGPLAQLRSDHRAGQWDKHALCTRCKEWHRP